MKRLLTAAVGVAGTVIVLRVAAQQPVAAPALESDSEAPDASVVDAAPDADPIAELRAKQAELERRLEVAEANVARESPPPPPKAPTPGVAVSVLGVPVRVFGTMTLRYDYSTNSDLTDQLTDGIQANWLLMRVRFGAEFGDTQAVIGGIRISSGESPNPTVPFVVLSDAYRPASFGLDQAWAAVRPFSDRERLQLVMGRLKNPFWRGSVGTTRTQLLWDDDVNPAGAAVLGQIYKSKAFTLEDTLSYMQVQSLLDSRFVGLTGVVGGASDQLRFLSQYADAAIAYYHWWNLNTGLSVPTAQPAQGFVSPQSATSAFLLGPGLQQTNTTVNYGPANGAATGLLDDTYRILNVTAQAKLPIKAPRLGDPEAFILADFAHNFVAERELTAQGNLASPNAGSCVSCTPVKTRDGSTRTAAQRNNGVGATLGARLGDKTYDRPFHPLNVWATYRYVESDATLATFTDSDLGAGTGYKGLGLGANYRVFKSLMASAQYFDFKGFPLMENHVQRLFLDVMGEF
ncbi:MAG: putative porin [Labilithrix sp.]